MDNYNYGSYYQPPRKRRSIVSYIIVAIIAGLLGGLGSAYIAPKYLYGKLIPVPEIYQVNTPSAVNSITIKPIDESNVVAAVAKKSVSTVVGITTIQLQRDFLWTTPVEGVGSGVIVHSDGYILTNSHVIGDGNAQEINVLFENGDSLEGRLLWYDATLDLAVVKVNANNLPVAELGDSDLVEVGQMAIAIGNPLGLDFQRTVTAGVISGLHRSIQINRYSVMEDLIQTDASINPGNSGGPLLNATGQVIGINTAKTQSGEGLGFSIPINLVKPVIEEIVESGNFRNVYIGFTGSEVAVYERQMNVDIKAPSGVVVIEIIENSPAYVAGLKPMDVIIAVDNNEVTSMSNLRKILYNYRIGSKATLTINRDGNISKVPVTFKEF
ncbi:trypsin-like peptidase domain-containing protein [Gudongella oleilytica]|jgi:S1-C subfamily serine protease|uniref:serine protease HtrA n=1 Tax=Gudongella oleilytica TaxID=1582259 RepID=UPI002A36FE98|nr:trypsin-like peptidase domain-containing protein [Gudongella oleilytica]MDY0257763.1 trypsin-like peptidase domain-containing protein [Gudongella oleilytica]